MQGISGDATRLLAAASRIGTQSGIKKKVCMKKGMHIQQSTLIDQFYLVFILNIKVFRLDRLFLYNKL